MNVTYYQYYGTFETRLHDGGIVYGLSAPDYPFMRQLTDDVPRRSKGYVVSPELITVKSIDADSFSQESTLQAVKRAHAEMQAVSKSRKKTLLLGSVTLARPPISPEKNGIEPASYSAPRQTPPKHLNSLYAWRNGEPWEPYHKVSLTLAERQSFMPGRAADRLTINEPDKRGRGGVVQAVICSDLIEIAAGAKTRAENPMHPELYRGELLSPLATSLIISSSWATELAVYPTLSPAERQQQYRNSLEQLAAAAFEGYDRLQDIVVVDGSYGQGSPQPPLNAHFKR